MVFLWGFVPFLALAQTGTPTQFRVASGTDSGSCLSALGNATPRQLLAGAQQPVDLTLPVQPGNYIVCVGLYNNQNTLIVSNPGPKYRTVIYTPTPTPTPTPGSVTGCSCQTDDYCSSLCTFEMHTTGVNYGPDNNRRIKCGPPPGDFCNRPKRTKGDADGNSRMDIFDYVYWLRGSRGARIPPSVNPDFNGDGVIDGTDLDIWKRPP